MPRWNRAMLAGIILVSFTQVVMAQKDAIVAEVGKRSDRAWANAQQIWQWAEPGYQESKSAQLLSGELERAGFRVERGVAGIPTAFVATIGQGSPVIGILGEYDALPDLSQEAVPFRKPRGEGGYGHACGHHLFGVASAEAAIAVGTAIRDGKINGTLKFFGCPAEEGGAAKVFMARDGVFKGVDVALHWHPASSNSAGDRSCLSRIAAKFRFYGKASHAAGSPEQGRSALDAVELTCHAAELMREHTPDRTRIHHVITSGGGAANVVPEFAEVFFYVRHPKSTVVSELYPRLKKCAEAGALATETKLEIEYLGGTMELLPNQVLAKAVRRNLEQLNDLQYDDAETQFALRLQETFSVKTPLTAIRTVTDVSGVVGMGSTDVGDVSWVVPTVGFSTATWVPGTPAHSWQAVACGGTTIARKGMNLAARTLAASAVDLFQSPKLVADAKAEHQERREGVPYQPLLEKGQKPPLNYRNPPKSGLIRSGE